ncbi:MAG: hypothetical protein JXO22_14315, partial [Phycisphaerae bacterium]|nr:hypothetical protein [Phycisphaerae bacterium]
MRDAGGEEWGLRSGWRWCAALVVCCAVVSLGADEANTPATKDGDPTPAIVPPIVNRRGIVAHVQIQRMISAFERNDYATAYRHARTLEEMVSNGDTVVLEELRDELRLVDRRAESPAATS